MTTMMRCCPRCDEALAGVTDSGMTVGGCPRCGGIWFDAGELEAAIRSGAARRLEATFQPLDLEAALEGQQPAGDCPACGITMRPLVSSWASGVRLDHCGQCGGAWVDDRELGRMEEALVALHARRAAAHPAAPAPAMARRAGAVTSLLGLVACPSCGERNNPTDVDCWACGGRLKPRADTATAGPARYCPVCSGDMRVFTAQGITIDGCPRCGGLWLDQGELGALVQLPADAVTELENQLGRLPDLSDAASRSMALRCPACKAAMQEQPFAFRSGIHIDRCGECDGVWVDAGELSAIQAYLAAGTA